MTANDLSSELVMPLLTTKRLGRAYEFLPSCVSTNDEVAVRALSGVEEGLVLLADAQTGGRGRRGRDWHSPAGENLYCSLLLRPALPARLAAPLTLLAGAALANALAGAGFTPRLKWPNDLLLDTPLGLRKVAGILTEMSSEGDRVRHVVLGVGINANATEFPEPLARSATSLAIVAAGHVDRGWLLAAFVNALEPIYDDFLANGPGPGLDAWNRHAILGQRCWVDREGERTEGVAQAVDETGALLLRTDSSETVAVHSGEVNWLALR